MIRPLAERLRPNSLDAYIGQQHLVGKGAVLRLAIESGNIPSFILWGPPGVGKNNFGKHYCTSIEKTFSYFECYKFWSKGHPGNNCKSQKVQQFFNKPNPILFIDEIHRFSKSQQDSLLGAVEKGVITLIGATTENPSFEVISALLFQVPSLCFKTFD